MCHVDDRCSMESDIRSREGLRTLIVTFIIMDSDETFLYTGQALEDIPRNITHVIVDPSVKEIGEEAFAGCSQLRNVEMCEGLERIGDWAFEFCTSLTSIRIPFTAVSYTHLTLPTKA